MNRHRAAGTEGHADVRHRLLVGVPLTGQRLDVNGVDTQVLVGGRGRTLLLLHGGIECGGVYWAPVATRLATTYRLIVPDVPGLGESAPVPRLGTETFDAWFAELVRMTCEDRPILVAHSLLGSFAARFAAVHGGLLRRLVVYSAPGIGAYRMPLGLRLVAMRFAVRPTEANAERFERWAFVDRDRARGIDPSWFDAWRGYTRERAGTPHVGRTMRQLVSLGTKNIGESVLGRIEIPTELVWGRQDRFVPLALAERTASERGWPLHVIDEAGHVPHIERADQFLEALARATKD